VPGAPLLEQDGIAFRDLNKNGRLDPYEDPRRPLEERVEDLLGQMTLAEKVGLMFHAVTGPPGFGVDWPHDQQVAEQHITTFNVYQLPGPRATADWHNALQLHAEGMRLGIPVTISSDPRHAYTDNPAASMMAGEHFSQWPEPIGLGATGDAELVREFGDVARQEYRAIGIRVALHPQIDLATEPRWARIHGTFGEDAELSGRLGAAYIRGFQGETLGPESVACMTKHFPGGGPQLDGEDPHFDFGKEQVYPGGQQEYHLRPFEDAFAAGTAQMMPYYGKPVGTEWEEVGFGFNRDVITGLLRGRYGFDGVVCTDWSLVIDDELPWGETLYARPWGVEELSAEERVLKIVEAGCDQFGGESCTDILLGLVEAGRIGEARIDESARRILRDKFRLGLFDDPYVDPDAAERIVGSEAFRAAGERAQRRSLVLLKNDGVLPVEERRRLYVEGIDLEVAAAYGELVDAPEDADLAVIRLHAPYEQREGFLASIFHAGSLEFPETERERIVALLGRVPTVVDIFLDRPAVIPEIAAASAALIGSFGASDTAVLDLVTGRFAPTGKLPFELPSSMEAARAQLPDVPHDSEAPLFPYGHGLEL
jgi:beta-glucosidase